MAVQQRGECPGKYFVTGTRDGNAALTFVNLAETDQVVYYTVSAGQAGPSPIPGATSTLRHPNLNQLSPLRHQNA